MTSTHDATLRQFQVGSLVVGVVAALACVCGALFFDRAQFYRAWLPAYVFFLGIVLGSLAILMIYHLTGGAWGFLIRRILEAQIRTLPLLAVMYIPIGVGVRELYLWAQPEAVAHDHLLQRQQFYLNPEFFWCRSAVYLLLWLFLAWRLVSWSRRQDEEPNPQLRWSLQRFSEIGLVLFGTSMHFAAFDWLEMLQPSFHSTIFPMLVVAGQLLSAMACTLIVYRRVCTWPDAAEVFSRRALNDLGNLQMTFLVVWAYLAWFQFMLIWMANLPVDVAWYVPRTQGVWLWATWLFIVLNFAVPMFLLLLRGIKRDPIALSRVAMLLCCMQLLWCYYLVVPAFPEVSFRDHWMDLLTPIAIGGLWLACFLWALRSRSLVPLNDHNRDSALHLREVDAEELGREELLAHA